MLFYSIRRLCIYKAVCTCSTEPNVFVVQVKYRRKSRKYQVSSMAILVFTCGPLFYHSLKNPHTGAAQSNKGEQFHGTLIA